MRLRTNRRDDRFADLIRTSGASGVTEVHDAKMTPTQRPSAVSATISRNRRRTGWILAALAGVFFAASFPLSSPAVPLAGLVAAYSFNEASGLTVGDSSGGGNNGTINGATWSTAGKYGNALLFNGASSYVGLANPTGLQITGSMTWAAWIRAAANPEDDGQIISKSGEGSGSLGWQFKTSPDTGPHTFAVGVSSNGNSITHRYSTTVRALNTWYHVAGVYDAVARTLNIYVNGVLDNGVLSGTVPASQFDPAQNAFIGRRPSGGYHFNGAIDELQLYNRALAASEIQTVMNTPIETQAPDSEPPTVPGAPRRRR